MLIELGSSCKNVYIKLINGKLRDELLNSEIFKSILEAKAIVGRWKREYGKIRPHSCRVINHQHPKLWRGPF